MFSISRLFSLYAAMVIAGLLAIAGTMSFALNTLRIGGDSYGTIVQAKDLVADILPPPLYLVEAYLETKLIADDEASLPEHAARLQTLRNDFNTRRDVWRAANLDPHVQTLLKDAVGKGETFWEQTLKTYIPALSARDAQAAKAAMNEINKIYANHRQSVDALVVAANDFQKTAEQHADDQNTFLNRVLMATTALVFSLVIAGITFLRIRAVRPVREMTTHMTALAAGHFEPVPHQSRTDEIGEMAASVAIFRQNTLDGIEARKREDNLRHAADRERAAQEADRAVAEAERNLVVQSLATGLEHLAALRRKVRKPARQLQQCRQRNAGHHQHGRPDGCIGRIGFIRNRCCVR